MVSHDGHASRVLALEPGDSAELRVDGPKGKPVSFRLSWPGHPAHESRPHNVRTILLLPDAVLSANTRFWVKVTYTYKRKQAERIWSFKTG